MSDDELPEPKVRLPGDFIADHARSVFGEAYAHGDKAYGFLPGRLFAPWQRRSMQGRMQLTLAVTTGVSSEA